LNARRKYRREMKEPRTEKEKGEEQLKSDLELLCSEAFAIYTNPFNPWNLSPNGISPGRDNSLNPVIHSAPPVSGRAGRNGESIGFLLAGPDSPSGADLSPSPNLLTTDH